MRVFNWICLHKTIYKTIQLYFDKENLLNFCEISQNLCFFTVEEDVTSQQKILRICNDKY